MNRHDKKMLWLLVVVIAGLSILIMTAGCGASASSDVSFEIVIPNPINRPLDTRMPLITDNLIAIKLEDLPLGPWTTV